MTSPANATIVLCADDYGIAPGVGAAIRDLLSKRRLTAVSCMSVFDDFAREGPLLAPFAGDADFGLHLTLTADQPLRRVVWDAYTGRLDRTATAAEIDRQLDTFAKVMGKPPAFIDGHQHVHVLPGVREHVLMRAAQLGATVRILDARAVANRASYPSRAKAAILALMGRSLSRSAKREGLAANNDFRGARSFKETAPYRELFKRMIAGAADGCLVMCHPGLSDEVLAARDPMTLPREDEYRYLASDTFPADLASAHLQLGRLPARR